MLTSILIWVCYTWAINRFCKKHFEITVLRERLFILLLFMSMLTVNMISAHYFIPREEPEKETESITITGTANAIDNITDTLEISEAGRILSEKPDAAASAKPEID